MAHTALVNGTKYQVGGGKALIDGTVYLIMTTKEVENTVVVSGVASSSAGNNLTLNDARFDWDKYKVQKISIVCKSGAVYNGNDWRILYALYENDGAVSYGACYYSYVRTLKLSIDATTNGTLKIEKADRYDSGKFDSVNYTIVLEAKT